MADNDRRHPNVINIGDVEALSREKGSRFGFSAKPLAKNAGAKGIGCTYYEQPPGRTAFPAHYHSANEEAIFVLEGRGSVRIGKDTISIGPGDWVTFPVGPEYAHCVTCTGDEPLRYLCLSTMNNVEVVGYPDSKKVGLYAAAPGSSWGDPAWERGLFRSDSAVDYYDGEDVD